MVGLQGTVVEQRQPAPVSVVLALPDTTPTPFVTPPSQVPSGNAQTRSASTTNVSSELIVPGDLRSARFSDAGFYTVDGGGRNDSALHKLTDGLAFSDGSPFFALEDEGLADARYSSFQYPCNAHREPKPDGPGVTIWLPDIPRMTQNPLQCPVRCNLVTGKDAVVQADAVLVDSAGFLTKDVLVYDWTRNPLRKILIGWNIENIEGRRKRLRKYYAHRYIGRDYEESWWDNFNLSVSYPLGSDIPLNYFNWGICRDRVTNAGVVHHANDRTAKKAGRAAVYIASNCEFTSHWRDGVVAKLREYFPVHGYGKCMKTHTLKNAPWCRARSASSEKIRQRLEEEERRKTKIGLTQKACVVSEYPFSLVIENSASIDYVTEKLYEPLVLGAIPVYLGAPNVENFVPTSHSIIKMSDFPSLASLARYLDCLLRRPQDLEVYLKWKTRPVFRSWRVFSRAYPPLCTACMRIKDGLLNRRRRPKFTPFVFAENRGSQAPLQYCFKHATAGG